MELKDLYTNQETFQL